MSNLFENECNQSFTQGDDVRYPFTLYQDDAMLLPVDLTGCTAASQIRTTDGVLAATFDVELTDLVNGLFTISLDKATTSAITVTERRERFDWDVEVTFGDGSTKTIVSGQIVIAREVTR